MISSTSLLISLAALASGGDPDSESVIRRVKQHFARIKSIRVRGTEYNVTSGGLWDVNPEMSRPVRETMGVVREFELWSSPPKVHWHWIERKGSSGSVTSDNHSYYDGEVYTYLKPKDRTGSTMKGGALVSMPPNGTPLHAVGYCFLDTYQSSIGELLAGAPKVTVKRMLPVDATEWLIVVEGLPKDLRPRDWLEKNLRRVLVKVWLTVSTSDLRINRWAVYLPGPTIGKPLPVFQLEGYSLMHGFVNLYENKVKQSGLSVPSRILHGNGLVTFESFIQQMWINPKERPDSFRPVAPRGYSITKHSEDDSKPITVIIGQQGTEDRVRLITQEARTILDSETQLRAPTFRLRDWFWPSAAGVLVLIGVATIVVAKRRRSP